MWDIDLIVGIAVIVALAALAIFLGLPKVAPRDPEPIEHGGEDEP